MQLSIAYGLGPQEIPLLSAIDACTRRVPVAVAVAIVVAAVVVVAAATTDAAGTKTWARCTARVRWATEIGTVAAKAVYACGPASNSQIRLL